MPSHSTPSTRSLLWPFGLACGLLLVVAPTTSQAQRGEALTPSSQTTASRSVASLDDPSLRAVALASRPGDELVVAGLPLFDGPLATLELERFVVFRDDAVIEVRGDDGARFTTPSDNRLFQGRVQGQPDSIVFLAVMETGDVRGLIADDDRLFMVGSQPASDARSAGVLVQQITDSELRSRETPFECRNDDHPSPVDVAELLPFVSPDSSFDAFPLPERVETRVAGPDYAVDVAIDSDYEFYQLFGSVQGATDYVETLMGAIAAIYLRDVDTQLQIPYLGIWTTSADPWNNSPGGIDGNSDGDLNDPVDTPSSLMQLRSYWGANHTGTSRTVTHLLRGRSAGFGVAYVGALCSHKQGLQYGPEWDYAYGLTTSISGSYSESNSVPVWDLVAVAHEIGHNFNSPHTQCYGVYTAGGPVDQCYSGDYSGGNQCYVGPTSVPSGGGTIMSYCHLKSGGMSNINLWFGRAGFYGTNSERVPERMLAHLASSQASGCLATLDTSGSLFEDDFESGNTNSW